jgi:DnaJ-class molecular chaperone
VSENNEPEPKEEKTCFDFLGAFHVCKGDLIRIKVSRETFIGEVEEVRDWGIVIKDQFGRPIVVRNKYIEYIVKFPKETEEDSDAVGSNS